MHDTPLISVITVTFNAEKYIERTMRSLEHQSFRDFEHIVIDGASKDTTKDIVCGLANGQTRMVSEPDHGLYDAMNKGLRLAKGKYVLFLNAGDKFHSPHTLQQYADKALLDSDIIYGDTIIVDNDGRKLGNRHLSVPEKLTERSFSNGMLICHQAFMVKKDLTSPYNLGYRFSADYDWCVNSIKKSVPEKCVNLHAITIDYLNDGLTDNNKKKSLIERFKIMKNHYGLPTTIFKHLCFIFRSLKRGKL